MGKRKQHFSTSNVKKGFVHFLSGTAITSIASFLVAIFLIRELSIENYAVYTTLSGVLILIMLLSNIGLERVIPRFVPELKQSESSVELMCFIWKLSRFRLYSLFVVLFIFILLSGFISNWFNFQFSLQLLFAFSLYVAGFAFSMHFIKLLQALLLQKQIVIGLFIEWFLKLLGLMVLFFHYHNFELELVFVIMAVTVWFGVFYFIFSLKKYFHQNQETLLLEHKNIGSKKIFLFALDNYFQTLLGFHTLPPTSKLIGASFLAAPALAGLGFAYAIVGVLKRYLPVNLLLGLVEPVIMARYADTKDFMHTTKLVGILLKLNLFLIIPMGLWFFISGENLLNFISNDKYGGSAWLISALLFVLVLESQRTILQLICNSIDQSGLLLKSNIFSFWLFPVWLYLSATFALEGLVLGLFIILIYRNFYVMNKLNQVGFGFKLDFRSVFIIVILSFAANLAAFFISNVYFSGLLFSLCSLVVAVVLYLGAAYLFKPFSEVERASLNSFIGKRVFVW